MNFNFDRKIEKTARVRKLLVAALALGCAFGTVNQAAAPENRIPSHSTPYYATSGKLRILGGPRGGDSGLYLPAQTHRPFHRFLDRQGRSPRSHPFSEFLRA